jgi:hypothetical protein
MRTDGRTYEQKKLTVALCNYAHALKNHLREVCGSHGEEYVGYGLLGPCYELDNPGSILDKETILFSFVRGPD